MSVDARAAADVLRERLDGEPEVLVVLGSGLGGLVDAVEEPVTLGFDRVPGFPTASVVGHVGRYVCGRLEGRRVLVQAGRFHAYEGHAMDVVVAPVRIAAALGIDTMIVTNAAGGINRSLGVGGLMLIEDHVNLMGRSPLAGPVQVGEERFPDMSRPYDAALQELAQRTASARKIPLARGTYGAMLGPSYETPAEVRMLAVLGADVVGMSTVPEVIAARALGLRVLGFSLVTNPAAGIGREPLAHEDVLAVGDEARAHLETLVRGVLEGLV